MSKFFQAGGDDSSSGSSSSDEESLYGSSGSEDLSDSGAESSDLSASEESESEESGSEASEADEADDQPRNQYSRNQFLKGQGDSDSDSDDEKVVVKSAKDKASDEVISNATTLERMVSSDDWVSALTTFDKLVKTQDKANKQYSTVPVEFVRSLTTLEERLNDKSNGGKKLSPSMSKAQNTLKQRIKKANREYSQRLESYKADPTNYVPGVVSVTELEKQAAARKSAAGGEIGGKKQPEARTTLATGAVVDESESSEATVFRTIISVAESRGRKNTDRQEQLTSLEHQFQFATTAYQKISILLMLIPLRFESNASNITSNANSHSSYAGTDFGPWEQIEKDIRVSFEAVESQSEYAVYENASEPEDIEQGPQATPATHGLKSIPGSSTTFVERLDDEHARILATYDPHTTEYIERLRDEIKLGDLILRAQCHQEKTSKTSGVKLTDSETFCRLLSRRIDHIYYKPAVVIAATEVAAWQRVPEQLNTSIGPRVTSASDVDSVELISQLCRVSYKQHNASLRARAMSSSIYQYALCDDYYQARDLMLMSHLQSQIHAAEPSSQVLFNRALVQVGLCAFRAGLINDSLQSSQEICGSSRIKESLGQGQARQSDANNANNANNASSGVNGTPDSLPYHMHINLELVECVYSTASMLTEVPYLANIAGMRSAQLDLKRRAQNRPFRRMLEQHDRQVFNGPSETTRDYVIQAAKSSQTGDWRNAYTLLNQIKVWSSLSLVTDSRSKVMAMSEHKSKIEGMRTYLSMYGAQAYHAVSLDFLIREFELNERDVKQLAIKMISGDEISALLDSTSKHLLFRPEGDVSRSQTLALALADKATSLAERNERLAADGHIPDQTPKRPLRARA